jgi:hypothetical protein
MVSGFFKTALLLKPRAELRVSHFIARAPAYAVAMFVLHRAFISHLLLANLAVAVVFGILMVSVEYFFFMATGGRDPSNQRR